MSDPTDCVQTRPMCDCEATSEEAMSAFAGPAKVVAAVAPGSLPVSSADSLLTNWYGRAMYLNGLRNTAFAEGQYTLSNSYKIQADIYDKCAEELRRELARATERQPEENKADNTTCSS